MQERSRSPAPPRPQVVRDTTEREQVGSFVPSDPGELRCMTPGCRRKLAEGFRGTIILQCPRCRQKFQFNRP